MVPPPGARRREITITAGPAPSPPGPRHFLGWRGSRFRPCPRGFSTNHLPLLWREPGWARASHDSAEVEHRRGADGGVALATNGWQLQNHRIQARIFGLHNTNCLLPGQLPPRPVPGRKPTAITSTGF